MTVEIENSAILRAQALKKVYKSRKILDDVTLSLRKGEIVGLLGPNGAGKTTCFSIMTGLIFPDSGCVFLDQTDITRLPMYQRGRLGVRYLPQETSIFRGLSVEKNIQAVLEIVEKNAQKRADALEKLLTEFDLVRVRYVTALALSGGERRRVEIARALAGNPHFILLDEPLAGIDPKAIEDIRDLIFHLKERNVGVLITDHNVRDTLAIVDRAYILIEGRVLKEGNRAEILADENVRRLYLGESFVF